MPPPATRAAPLPREERRASIVAAFLPLLIERGPGVTTKQVADAAGIAEGTLFKAFDDKDDLIQAAVDAVTDPTSFEASLDEIDTDRALEDQLVVAVGLLQRRIVDIWRVIGVLPHQPQQHAPIQISPGLVTILAAHADTLDVSPVTGAQRLRAIALALTHPLMVDQPATPEQVVHQFLHGVAIGGGRS
jgi:AcrR family transcriptional regulator